MIRYIAFHESEPGFDTAAEVASWIAQQFEPESYSIAATTDDFKVDPIAEQAQIDARARELEQMYLKGKDYERSRIKAILGI